jgi:hypothetical protein
MVRNIFLIGSGILISAMLLGLSIPVSASNEHPQANYATPTPDQNGRVIYVVQPNDTCTGIALWTGVDENRLRQLNKLDENCTIVEGQQLLLGLLETQVPTPGPSPTSGPQQPTPTPFNGSGIICVYLFDDLNGNALSETTEAPIAGGAISITDRSVQISKTGTTTGDGLPVCFEELPEGDYNISVAPPEGYNPTTIMNYPLTLTAGDRSIVDFGAQLSSLAEPGIPPEEGRTPLLGIFGGLLVLIGIGLAIYVRLLKRA